MAETKPWWFTQDEEQWHGAAPTRDEAIAAGTLRFGGEPFLICQGGHFRNRFSVDIDWLADRFDDENADYAGEDGEPSTDWSDEHRAELERELSAAFEAWGKRHGYDKAWAIDCGDYERIVPESPGASIAPPPAIPTPSARSSRPAGRQQDSDHAE